MTAAAQGTLGKCRVFAAINRDHVSPPTNPTARPTTTARTSAGIRSQMVTSLGGNSDCCFRDAPKTVRAASHHSITTHGHEHAEEPERAARRGRKKHE